MRRRLGAALVLCLVLPACARNPGQPLETPVAEVSPSPEASPSPTAPPVPVTLPGVLNNMSTADLTSSGLAVSLEMRLADLAFDPTFVKVAPGANVTLSLKNDGDLADHTFTIDALAVDQRLVPGEDAQIVVQLPSEGAFRFYCKLHVDRGMQGAFYFNEGEQPSETSISSPAGGSSTSASGTRRSSSGSGGSGTRSSGAAGANSAGPEGGEFDLFIPDLMVNVPDPGGSVGSGQRSSDSSTNLAPEAGPAQQPVNTPPRVEGPTEGSRGSAGQDSEPGAPGKPGTQGTVTE